MFLSNENSLFNEQGLGDFDRDAADLCEGTMDNDEMHFEVGSFNLFSDVGFEERHLETRARFLDTRERILERHFPLVAIGPEIRFMKASINLQSVSGFRYTLWGGLGGGLKWAQLSVR